MKKLYLVIVSFLFFFTLLFSCKESNSIKEILTLDDCPIVAIKSNSFANLIICDISLVKDTFNIPLGSLLSSFDVIQLENKDEALVDTKGHTSISDNYICVYSSTAGVKLFDRKGKYLCNISSVGQGPNEYLFGIYDEFIDENNNKLYLLPYRTNKILVFDLQGNALDPIPLPYLVHKGRFRISQNHNRLLLMTLPFADTKSVIWVQDLKGNILQEIDASPFVIEPADYSNDIIPSQNEKDIEFSLFHWSPTNADTLYHYDESFNHLNPVFTIKFNEEVIRHEYKELPKHYIVKFVVPSSLSEIPRSPQIIIDKKTLRGCYMNLKINMLGDIDGPTWELISRGYYTANMYPYELKEQLKSALSKPLTTDMRNKVLKLYDSIDEDDNNIIFIGKLKTF